MGHALRRISEVWPSRIDRKNFLFRNTSHRKSRKQPQEKYASVYSIEELTESYLAFQDTTRFSASSHEPATSCTPNKLPSSIDEHAEKTGRHMYICALIFGFLTVSVSFFLLFLFVKRLATFIRWRRNAERMRPEVCRVLCGKSLLYNNPR